MDILKEMKTIRIRSDIPAFLSLYGMNRRICEVGVRFGYNFQQLLSCKPELAIGIDHYRNKGVAGEQDTGLDQGKLDKIHADTFLRFLSFPCARILRERSEVAVTMFPLSYFDFIYVDADHTREGALKDIRLWWGRVRQGGILAGHDYIETTSQNGVPFGVVGAVAEFLKEKKIPATQLHVTGEGYRTWMLYKQEGE